MSGARIPSSVAALSSLALWVAENVGTMTGTWLYSGQVGGEWVGLPKLGSWYLLYVASVTVTLVSRRALSPVPVAPPGPEGRLERGAAAP